MAWNNNKIIKERWIDICTPKGPKRKRETFLIFFISFWALGIFFKKNFAVIFVSEKKYFFFLKAMLGWVDLRVCCSRYHTCWIYSSVGRNLQLGSFFLLNFHIKSNVKIPFQSFDLETLKNLCLHSSEW